MPERKSRLAALAVAAVILVVTPLAVVGTDTFIDVPTTNVHHDDISWLSRTEVSRGCNPAQGNTRYCPNDPVTRAQMATFLRRLAERKVVKAATAEVAETANIAANASQLGGKNPSAYETRLAGSAHGAFTELVSGIHDLASATITAPGPGTVVLLGNASWEADNDVFLVQWIERGPFCIDPDNSLVGSLSTTWLEGSSGFDTNTVTSLTVAPITTTNPTTYLLCAWADETVFAIDQALVAQWVPAGSSTVSIASGIGSRPSVSEIGPGD